MVRCPCQHHQIRPSLSHPRIRPTVLTRATRPRPSFLQAAPFPRLQAVVSTRHKSATARRHGPTAGPLPGQPSNWELYGKPYEAHPGKPSSTTGVSTTIATSGAVGDKATSTYYKDGRDHKDVAISLGAGGQQVIDVYHQQPVSVPVPYPVPVGYPTKPAEGVSIIDTQVTVGKGDSVTHGHQDVIVQDSTTRRLRLQGSLGKERQHWASALALVSVSV